MNAQTLLSDVMQRPLPDLAPAEALGAIPGWDSLKMVRLMLRLEEHVGRELTEDELGSIATVGDVERLLG